MILFPVIFFAGLFVAFILQQFLPSLPYDARLFLLPIFVFYSALALPFWMMLVTVAVAGFTWDAVNLTHILSTGQWDAEGNQLFGVEIPLGWSIIVLATFGMIMSGLRPLFQRGRWETIFLLSGLTGLFTSMIVFAEFLMLSFKRGGFVFPNEIWWRIGGAGIAAAVIAPLIFTLLNAVASACGYVLYSTRESSER